MPDPSSKTVCSIYQDLADRWDTLRGQTLMEKPWLDEFLRLLPESGADVLDLGCGSGQPIARYLIGHGCRVTGVDAAPAMIDLAQKTFPDHRWVKADMRILPTLGTFHGLIAWHSFFHLPHGNQRRMFETFSNLSRPGAALMFTSGTVYGESIGKLDGQPLYHASFDSSEYRELLNRHGFDIVQHKETDPACGNATVWLARKRSAAIAS